MPGPDLRSWFGGEELTDCPQCGHRSAIRTSDGSHLYCLECGEIAAEQEDGAAPAEPPAQSG